LFLALLPELLAVLNRQGDGGFPKLGPGGMSAAGQLGLLGRHIEGAAATPLGPSDIEVGTVAANGIAMASTVGVATAARGFREATLGHDRGGGQQFAEQLLPTHTNILGKACAAVKKKAMFWHGDSKVTVRK
jgi:hypothetical protein